jgi:hypothetical protein
MRSRWGLAESSMRRRVVVGEIGLALDLAFSSRNLPRMRQAADEKCGHDQVPAALRSRLHASGAASLSRDWIVQWLAEGRMSKKGEQL